MCAHHRVIAEEIAAYFVGHVISNQRKLHAMVDAAETDKSTRRTAELLDAMTAQAEAYAIGVLCGAAEHEHGEAMKPSRRLRRAPAVASIVRATGRHTGEAEAREES